MKNQILIICFMSVLTTVFAQAPQKINYQAVARSTSGNVIANQNLGVRVNIRQTSVSGTVVYSEMHTSLTNEYGLFNLSIGTGSVISGFFSSIQWGGTPHFLEIGIDTAGGTNFVVIGTTELLSVPYALYAEKTPHPQLKYQTLLGFIPTTTIRNTELFTADSLVVEADGTYLINYNASGGDNFNAIASSPDLDSPGQSYPYDVTAGTPLLAPLYFTTLETGYLGVDMYVWFTNNQVSTQAIRYLAAGTVLKGCARVNASGSPTSDWFVNSISMNIIKIAP